MAKRTKKINNNQPGFQSFHLQSRECYCGMSPVTAFLIIGVTSIIGTFVALGFNSFLMLDPVSRVIQYCLKFLIFFIPSSFIVLVAYINTKHAANCAHHKK